LTVTLTTFPSRLNIISITLTQYFSSCYSEWEIVLMLQVNRFPEFVIDNMVTTRRHAYLCWCWRAVKHQQYKQALPMCGICSCGGKDMNGNIKWVRHIHSEVVACPFGFFNLFGVIMQLEFMHCFRLTSSTFWAASFGGN